MSLDRRLSTTQSPGVLSATLPTSFPGYLLLAGTQRLRGSKSLTILRQIAAAPYASPDEIRRRQFRRLSALLAHAEARVPYYRDLFRSLGSTSRDIRTLEDFAQLPVLTKDVVRDRWRDLVREDVPLDSLSPHFSGGSTGVPLRFYRDRAYMDASDAGDCRNYMQAGWRPGEMIAFFWGSNERLLRMSRAEFELRQWARRKYQFDPFHSGPAEMQQWLKRWPSLRASIAHGYASTVARFAEFVESSRQRVAPLKGVFTTAERLYSPQRAIIERAFGCRVFDCYGSSEVQNIAAECRLGRMHVNADFVVVEVDPAAPAPAAGTGRPLLLTSLWNYAMPFIRYRNEDCADLLEDRCACGNNFPLMSLSVARVSDNFRMPDGRVVHGEFFTHLMYGSEGIRNFQFHQTAPDRIVLHYVPGPGDPGARSRALDAAVTQIQALTPLPVQIDLHACDEIPLSAAGKHRFTKSDVQ